MSIYKTAVERPVTTLLVFVAVVILGLFSLTRLTTDLYPDIEMNAITVITPYTGAGAADIENTITRPVENTLITVSNVKHIRSNSVDNFSTVSLEFNSGTDMAEATNDIRDKLDRITSALPKEVSKPMIFRFGMDDIPVMVIAVSSQESTPGLNKLIDEKVTSRLSRIKGVGSVEVSGAPVREINIYCDPQRLEAYNISVAQVSQAISLANRNVPIGTIDVGSKTSSIRLSGEFTSVQELQNIIIMSQQGRNIYLHDLAKVHDGNKERMQESFTNEYSGGFILVRKQSGANTVEICDLIKEELPSITKTLPSDVELTMTFDTSKYVKNTINSLLETVLIIFMVVVVVVLFFLGRWRATFIIILTIPISLIAAFIYLMATGNTLNVISLSALSIAIGMVVDDAIVVLENVTTHIERGSHPKQAAVYATSEVSLSVIASTLTMLAVFLPLTMITGFTGVLFRQLGWVVSIVMIISTVAALTLTPMLSSQMLRRNPKNSAAYDRLFVPINKFLNSLDQAYARLLDWSLRHRKSVVAISLALFVASLLLTPLIKTEFLPTGDQGQLTGTIELPQGYNKEAAKAFAVKFMHNTQAKYADDLSIFTYTVGQADDDNIYGAMRGSGNNVISVRILMKDFEERKHTTDQFADLIRKDLANYPELERFDITTGEGMNGGDPVAVEIYGYSFEQTNKVIEAVTAKLKEVPAISSIKVSRKASTPEYNVIFDDDKLALYGLTRTTAATALHNAINGTTSGYFREDGREYAIRVRFAPEYRNQLSAIENVLIDTPMGRPIRLRDLGRIVERETPPTIERKDRERYVSIGLNATPGFAMSDLVAEANKAMATIEIPDGVSWKLAGQFENQQDSFSDLFMLMILIIILVFIVMAAQFESFVDPFVIMFSVPFALSGVILGLVISGTPMGLMALVGAIMLIGIVVKNGIVLIDYTKLCRERGLGIIHSVVTAGKSRLRPVLMTTATTVLGMLPLAFGQGEGADMWRSMGMTVAAGLTVSTLLTLVLVPTIYAIFAGRGVKRKRKAHHRRLLRHSSIVS